MKYNLGAGNKFLEGWINVDLYAEKVDVRKDLAHFLPDGVVYTDPVEVLLRHVIEHFDGPTGARIIAEWAVRLKPGGTITIEMPDRAKCVRLLLFGLKLKDSDRILEGAKGIMGGRDQDKARWHAWLCSVGRLIVDFAAVGGDVLLPAPEPIWRQNGEEHVHIWTAEEIQAILWGVGLTATIEQPGRFNRDMKVIGRR